MENNSSKFHVLLVRLRKPEAFMVRPHAPSHTYEAAGN